MANASAADEVVLASRAEALGAGGPPRRDGVDGRNRGLLLGRRQLPRSAVLFRHHGDQLSLPRLLRRELRAGRFSRWCPGLYCGFPLYSESQAGYFHPLKYLLYPWLETWKAFNLDTVLSIWLTGLGTYGWLRRHVGASGADRRGRLRPQGVCLGAPDPHKHEQRADERPLRVLVTRSGLGAREVVAPGPRRRGGIACQVFAGHLQDTILTAGAVGLYTVYRTATEIGRKDEPPRLGWGFSWSAWGSCFRPCSGSPPKELLDRSPRAAGFPGTT